MREAFEKINNLLWHKQMQALSRFNELNDLPFNLRKCYDESDLEEAIAQSFEEAQTIVSEVEAEYGNGWIPCNRADHPYDGQRVLACINTRIATNEIIITDYNGEIYWFDGTISAWMPLPEAYKPGKGV